MHSVQVQLLLQATRRPPPLYRRGRRQAEGALRSQACACLACTLSAGGMAGLCVSNPAHREAEVHFFDWCLWPCAASLCFSVAFMSRVLCVHFPTAAVSMQPCAAVVQDPRAAAGGGDTELVPDRHRCWQSPGAFAPPDGKELIDVIARSVRGFW